MRLRVSIRPLIAGLALLSVTVRPATAPAAELPTPDYVQFFETRIRPLLAEKCLKCHGPDKQKAGLRLDSGGAIRKGGGSGKLLIVSAKPEESLLLRAIRHSDGVEKMPPDGKLKDSEIADLAAWVKSGAIFPAADRAAEADPAEHWAFRPVGKSPVPAVKDVRWPMSDLDRFVLARLEAAGLRPEPPADKRTLLRRVTFDLTGLPPTPGDVDAFLGDGSPGAFAKVVDRLLASPAYGEKWGRRWLDVARYADSNGMDENLAYVNAWRYRDWVIRSFNADQPYDTFIRDQIAGDLVPGGTNAQRAERLVATGFLVIGPKMLAEDDPVKMRMDIIDEQLDTLGQAFMGLTLGCARCHNHKFDPITMGDYYGLAGIFHSTKTMRNHTVVAAWNERPVGPPAAVAAMELYEKKLAAARADLTAVQKPAAAAVAGFAAAAVARIHRDRVADMEKGKPPLDEAMAVEDVKGENLRIHLRGNHLTLGAEAPRRFPRIIAGDKPLSLGADRSGRWELAEWLTRSDHPLTARVMVNRVWAGHFGAGLVRSPDNFGRLGERPTHPELLDWLAAEFVANQWSVKRLHRLIVNSATYRMASRPDTLAHLKDPENRLLSHFGRRRLDAEEIRDGMLAVSGRLDRTMGGTLLKASPRQYVTSTANRNYDGYSHSRRSVYLPVVRSAVYDVFQTLDFPDPSVLNGQRTATTIPTQALFMLNGALADQAAEALAKSVLEMNGDDAARVRESYRRVHARAPTAAELDRVLVYLKKSESAADPKLTPDERRSRTWRGLCRVLFASNEFVFLE